MPDLDFIEKPFRWLAYKHYYWWYSPWGALIAIFFALVTWQLIIIKIFGDYLLFEILEWPLRNWLLIALVISFFVKWLSDFILPINFFRKNKTIYVLVAIKCNTFDQYELVRRQLFDHFKGRLTDIELREKFRIRPVLLNSYRCDALDTFVKARKYLEEVINGDLLVWGNFDSDSARGLIRLDFYVRHNRIPVFVSNIFSKQASLIAPKERIFNIQDALPQLSKISKKLNMTATFMIGKAALLSRSYLIAKRFSSELLSDIRLHYPKGFDRIKDIVGEDIYFADFQLSSEIYLSFRQTGNLEHLQKGLLNLEDALKRKPESAEALNLMAIYKYFFGDLSDAQDLVNRAIKHGRSLATFDWSRAFLVAASGNLKEATFLYWNCFRKSISERTCREIVDFIAGEVNDGKKDLSYVLGIILRNEGSFSLSFQYFKKFVNLEAVEERHPWAYKRAKEFMGKMEKKSQV